MSFSDFSKFKEAFGLHLNDQQDLAVQTVNGPVLLLAVPGSGKTTVLVSRIGYMCQVLGIKPWKILTMTYTVAAAGDMRQRYTDFFGENTGLEFRTINGICAKIIRIYERVLNRTAFSLLEDGGRKSAILSELYRKQTGEFATESTIRSVQTAITYVKNQMLKGKELEHIKVEGADFPALYQAYCSTLREHHLMDYDDQMVYALQILRQYPEILNRVQNRYQYFCVDEAQDTSKIQHTIIRLLASRSGNLFMVGDEDQSIYGFRAAYPQALTEFERSYPEAKVLYMEQNYRSTNQIVAAADQFIRKNKNRHPKHMTAVRGNGPDVGEIKVYDRQKQYQYLCKLAKTCREETAVLYRNNDSALPLIDMLDREGIPYRCRQVDSLFFTNRVVRDISDIIRLAEDPGNGECFLNIYYKLRAGISKAAALDAANRSANSDGEFNILDDLSGRTELSDWTRNKCKELKTHFQNMLEESGDRAVYRITHFMGYGTYLEESGIDPYRAEILEVLGLAQPSPGDLLRRLEELKKLVQDGSSGDADCPFILSTIHSSKGLEYERVYLMDIVDGILPNSVPEGRANREARNAYEEERRLFYVGMTRAKQELSVFRFRKDDLNSTFSEEIFPKQQKPSRSLPSLFSSRTPKPKKKKPDRQILSLAESYTVGKRVVHQAFGPGEIVARKKEIASIQFDSGEKKNFSMSLVLEKGLLWMEDQ